MMRLILPYLAIVALGAGSVFAQNTNTANKAAKPVAAERAKTNPRAIRGGSTVTPGGVTIGGRTNKASSKKPHRKPRRRSKKT